MRKKAIKATLKALWPKCTNEIIQNVAIKEVEKYWLDPNSSFVVDNLTYSKLDLPMTSKAFLFRCFQNMNNVPLSNVVVNKKLFKFCVTYSKPQYEVWTLKKISLGKKIEEVRLGDFTNYKFTVLRESNNKQFVFTFVDLPIMNPYD